MPPATNAKTDQFSQLVDRLGGANNVLVTVSENPSVDQLAACIGLTLALNKQGKHATAVFSGKVPSTLEFLQPEKTIETNTNSLRDFIIALDKSKADKLRYKVEDDFVKIFITPYRTSISEKDLEFTQGDFNIDLIITLGVHEREHLDGAIVAHGRILHDATVASINADKASEIGSLKWVNESASSLCEMVSDLISEIDKELFDSQISTALLTGLVAETDRFGNDKAKPHTMSVSGVLMAAGASPQLIADKLQEPEPEPEPEEEEEPEIPEVVEGEGSQPEESPEEEEKEDDGTFHIEHIDEPEPAKEEEPVAEEPKEEKPKEEPEVELDEDKKKAIEELKNAREEMKEDAKAAAAAATDQPSEPVGKSLITEPPQLSGQLTANTIAEHDQSEGTSDAMSMKSDSPLLDHAEPAKTEDKPAEEFPDGDERTLHEIEESVNSMHLDDVNMPDAGAEVPPPPPVDDARSAVEEAAKAVDDYHPAPPVAQGSTPVDLQLEHEPELPAEDSVEQILQEEQQVEDKNDNPPPPVPPPPIMPPGV